MTQKQDTTKMDAMLWQFMTMEDPMLGIRKTLRRSVMVESSGERQNVYAGVP